MTVAILHGFVPNEGDAWRYTLDEVRLYLERALVRNAAVHEVPVPTRSIVGLTAEDPPALVGDLVGAYLEKARLLGLRTAELHRALAAQTDDAAFAPEPFTTLYQRSMYQSGRTLTARSFALLRDRLGTVPKDTQADARRLLERESAVLRALHEITSRKLPARRTRVHGDFHLGQVLHTGRDFVIIDFEGEPARPLGERRLKRSPLRDVAGMLRSFDYATQTVLRGTDGPGVFRTADLPVLRPWGAYWRLWVSSAFLRAYLRGVAGSGLVPTAGPDLELLLRVLLLEKSVYELAYELNNRPTWVGVPICGILDLVPGEG
jgi:maltose alpha-D-glucosyltransferase/alpha-amylase